MTRRLSGSNPKTSEQSATPIDSDSTSMFEYVDPALPTALPKVVSTPTPEAMTASPRRLFGSRSIVEIHSATAITSVPNQRSAEPTTTSSAPASSIPLLDLGVLSPPPIVSTPKSYVGIVVEENGEFMLQFDHEMLFELGWGEGDEIVWEIRDDTIFVRRFDPESSADNGQLDI